MAKTLLAPLVALLLLPALASAAPSEMAPAERYDSDEGARITEAADGTREIVIDDDEAIEGDRLVPGGIQINSRKGKVHRSMITIRGEFIPLLIGLSNDI